jgi:hypothetical protein
MYSQIDEDMKRRSYREAMILVSIKSHPNKYVDCLKVREKMVELFGVDKEKYTPGMLYDDLVDLIQNHIISMPRKDLVYIVE